MERDDFEKEAFDCEFNRIKSSNSNADAFSKRIN